MTPQPVLAIDFPGAGHAADFGFLMKTGAAALVRRVDPLIDHLSGPLTLEEQARGLIARLAEPPGLVLTYCGTAALGAHIAELATARLLAVDPYPVTMADIHRDFADLCRTVGCDPPGYAECASEADIALWISAIVTERDRLAAVYGGDADAYQMVDDLFARYRGGGGSVCAGRERPRPVRSAGRRF